MTQNVNLDGLKRAMTHVPESLNIVNLVGASVEIAYVHSDEYEQEMKKAHPDWYKNKP